MSVSHFENNRWSREDQKLEFRHLATLSMVNSGTVLDLGCGDGLLMSLLKEKGIQTTGLDISETGVLKAREKGLDATVFDFSNPLPYADATFDTVIMLDLLEHLYDPEFLLKEARRVTKRDVIIGVPNFSSLPARIQMLLGQVPENNRPKKGHIFWFNHRVLRAMCERNNLRIIDIRSNTIFESIPLVSFITRYFAKVMPNIFSLSFVLRARTE